MTEKAAPNPSHLQALDDLLGLTVRATRVVVRVMEVEQQVAELTAGFLPDAGAHPETLAEARESGRDIDGAAEMLRAAVPRVDALARSVERLTRSARRTVALARRLEAGWPQAAGRSDTRQAMLRRQVGRRVSQAIGRAAADDREAAERLFAELDERLGDPEMAEALLTLPVEEIVRLICDDLGLVVEALRDAAPGGGRAPDTG